MTAPGHLEDLLVRIAQNGSLPRGVISYPHVHGALSDPALPAVLHHAHPADLHDLFRHALQARDEQLQRLVARTLRDRLDVSHPAVLETHPEIFHKPWLLAHAGRLTFVQSETALGVIAAYLRALNLSVPERLAVCFPPRGPQRALLAATLLDAHTTSLELEAIADTWTHQGIGGLTTWLELLKHPAAGPELARRALRDPEVATLVIHSPHSAPRELLQLAADPEYTRACHADPTTPPHVLRALRALTGQRAPRP